MAASKSSAVLPMPVPWPVNLAWRIRMRRFAEIEYFLEIRRNKAFAMPFCNWQTTFQRLTLKDVSKIRYMPTEVLVVPPDAMVADMLYIDQAFMFFIKNNSASITHRRSEPMLEKYQETMIPYSRFVENPHVFERPEIMIDRAAINTVPYRVTTLPAGTNPHRRAVTLALLPLTRR